MLAGLVVWEGAVSCSLLRLPVIYASYYLCRIDFADAVVLNRTAADSVPSVKWDKSEAMTWPPPAECYWRLKMFTFSAEWFWLLINVQQNCELVRVFKINSFSFLPLRLLFSLFHSIFSRGRPTPPRASCKSDFRSACWYCCSAKSLCCFAVPQWIIEASRYEGSRRGLYGRGCLGRVKPRLWEFSEPIMKLCASNSSLPILSSNSQSANRLSANSKRNSRTARRTNGQRAFAAQLMMQVAGRRQTPGQPATSPPQTFLNSGLMYILSLAHISKRRAASRLLIRHTAPLHIASCCHFNWWAYPSQPIVIANQQAAPVRKPRSTAPFLSSLSTVVVYHTCWFIPQPICHPTYCFILLFDIHFLVFR